MTKEEIIKMLKARGIPVGEWEHQKEKDVKSPIIEKQKENLRKMASLIEMQIQQDVETMADLHIALQKVKGRKDVK
tara:strand:- start:701 stop:928 length:228 start_codon:yes stop_codon:yes gene_type:complete